MNHTALLVLKTITSIWSIGLYLSPAPAVYRIHKAKSTGETQLIPFVTMFCNYHIWAMYSLFVDDLFPLFCTTIFAELMAVVYTLVYARYAQDKKLVLKTVAIAAVLVSLITLYAALGWVGVIPQSNSSIGLVLGYIGDITTCLFFASPLIKIRTVIQTRSAACIIVPMCIMGGIGNVLWVAYSMAASNTFILVPNVICLCLNALQVFLSIKYNSNKTKGSDNLTVCIEIPSKTDERVILSPTYHAVQSPLAPIGLSTREQRV